MLRLNPQQGRGHLHRDGGLRSSESARGQERPPLTLLKSKLEESHLGGRTFAGPAKTDEGRRPASDSRPVIPQRGAAASRDSALGTGPRSRPPPSRPAGLPASRRGWPSFRAPAPPGASCPPPRVRYVRRRPAQRRAAPGAATHPMSQSMAARGPRLARPQPRRRPEVNTRWLPPAAGSDARTACWDA